MRAAPVRVARAAAALALLLVGLGGLLRSRGPLAASADDGGPPPDAGERTLLTERQREVYSFYNDKASGASSGGRGLFETDFFKPPPAPPPKPPPPPAPTTRELPVIYRGLASFEGGGRVAYLTVENRTLTLAAGESVADGWTLAEFDFERATLAKADKTITVGFNRRAVLVVPVKK